MSLQQHKHPVSAQVIIIMSSGVEPCIGCLVFKTHPILAHGVCTTIAILRSACRYSHCMDGKWCVQGQGPPCSSSPKLAG